MRALLFCLLLVGCEQRKGPGAEMKPAEQWNAPAAPAADPHAGVPMNDPHAGMAIDDPHAGMAIDDPHAGLDMGGQRPVPAQIDPNKYLRGTLELGKGMKAPGSGVIFLSVRPAAGGPPLAVDLIQPAGFPIRFEITEANTMIQGTAFGGDVVVQARWDQDQDVDTKQPGDLLGKTTATIPAEGLKVILDQAQ